RSPQLGQDFTIASQSIIAVRAWMRAGTATESKLTHGPRGFRKLIASGPHRAVGQRRLAACRKLRRKVGNSAAHGSNEHGRLYYSRLGFLTIELAGTGLNRTLQTILKIHR